MRSLLFLLIVLLGFSALFGATWLSVRALYPEAYPRYGKKLLLGVLTLWVGGIVVGALSRSVFALPTIGHVALAVSASIVVLLACTFLPLWVGMLVRVLAGSAPNPNQAEPTAGTTRREILLTTSRIIPAAGVAVAAGGVVGGLSGAQLKRIELTFPNLPPDLDGFSILHYTDMHLGTFVDLYEVDNLVELGRQATADLVVLTGDIADEIDWLPSALKKFESLAPRHGVIASIGNHEYFRGITKTLRAYAKTDVEMLIENSASIRVGDATLFIGGADDPRILRGDKMAFMERTVNAAIDGAPSDGFRLLLSHRPEGFVPGAKLGFDLTLSGHTHGAQLGFDGRSLLESFMPDRYLWGAYAAGDRRLYTSSGTGHWFPFRVGCPREVPLIVLRRGLASVPPKIVRLA